MRIIFLVVLFSLLGIQKSYSAVTITAPSLNISLCTNTFPSSYYGLGNIVISEAIVNDISIPAGSTNYTITLTAPANFQFNPGVGTINTSSGDITTMSITITATTITITYSSSEINRIDEIDVVTISGIQIRAITAAASQTITKTASSTTIAGLPNTTVVGNLSSSVVTCLPGGVNNGNETWLRADMGTVGGIPLTGWNNQITTGTATILNGSPNINTISTSYNYNPFVDFTAPVFTQDGGIHPSRQCIRLAGFNGINGVNYRALHFAFELTDLTRVNTHSATVDGVTFSTPVNGTLHGDADILGTTAANLLEAYDIVDFGTSAPAGTWQRNAVNILSNANHSNIKHILSTNCTTGGSTTLNSFLGGQADQIPASSFAGHARDWRGPVAELIGFRNQLTVNERQRIDSYLAIKYGITLPNNYLSTTSVNIYTTLAPYNNNIIGIGRDDTELLNQKQSHYNDDRVRLYRGTLTSSNALNTSTFATNISYVVMGDNNGVHCATAAALAEMPTGLPSCSLYSRIAKEWKIQRTNMGETFNIDIRLDPCGIPASVSVADLRFLVDTDGNFTTGPTQCYYNGDGTGIVISYSAPYITISNISTTHIPDNSTRFFTIASVNIGTPLPIELLSFNCTNDEVKNGILLQWSTASEVNNDYFLIEKSTDAINYAELDRVNGLEYSNQLVNYFTYDLMPIVGDNYYRLKQVDVDGMINVYDIVVCTYNENLSDVDKIYVYDSQGKLVFDKKIYSNKYIDYLTSEYLAAGVYVVKILYTNGHLKFEKKLIVN